MNKTKITEIRVPKIITRKIRHSNGEIELKKIESSSYKEPKYVEGWPRFGSFLIDIIFILLLEVMFGVLLGIILSLINKLHLLNNSTFDISLRIFVILFLRPIYYIIFEGTIQATPAKLILKRVVVNEYGEKPSLKQIIIRSYSRIVPFEVFSCLGTLGWHDTWSKTFVLRKKDLEDLLLTLKIQEINLKQNDSESQNQELT